jgi:hypothetical protein
MPIMVKSDLLGPFPLTQDSITEHVVEADGQWSAGAFVLGRLEDRRFFFRRTGRSDTDMTAKLADFIGQYDAFKFRTYASTRRAYEKECRLFHDFKPKDNDAHPEKPIGKHISCPIASCPEAD